MFFTATTYLHIKWWLLKRVLQEGRGIGNKETSELCSSGQTTTLAVHAETYEIRRHFLTNGIATFVILVLATTDPDVSAITAFIDTDPVALHP